MVGDDNGMDSGTFGCADYCPHIADIRNVVEKKDERNDILVDKRLDDINIIMIADRGDCGDDTLMIT